MGMMGANDLEEAQIDCICEHLRDCKDKYMKAKTNPDTKAAYFATEMPEFMAKVEKTCVGPWLCGSKCTLADAAAYVFVKEFFDASRARPRLLPAARRSPRRSRPSGSSL